MQSIPLEPIFSSTPEGDVYLHRPSIRRIGVVYRVKNKKGEWVYQARAIGEQQIGVGNYSTEWAASLAIVNHYFYRNLYS